MHDGQGQSQRCSIQNYERTHRELVQRHGKDLQKERRTFSAGPLERKSRTSGR